MTELRFFLEYEKRIKLTCQFYELFLKCSINKIYLIKRYVNDIAKRRKTDHERQKSEDRDSI